MNQLKDKTKLNKWLIICSLSFLTFGILLLIFRKRILTLFGMNQVQDLETDKPDNSPVIEFYKTCKTALPDWDDLSIRYLVAHAMHETGIFKSKLFLEHNNAFGMMYPSMRETTAHSGTASGYSHYKTVLDSVKDMELYFKAKEYPVLSSFVTIKEYAKKLKDNGYYTDTILIYGNALHNHFNTLKTLLQ